MISQRRLAELFVAPEEELMNLQAKIHFKRKQGIFEKLLKGPCTYEVDTRFVKEVIKTENKTVVIFESIQNQQGHIGTLSIYFGDGEPIRTVDLDIEINKDDTFIPKVTFSITGVAKSKSISVIE